MHWQNRQIDELAALDEHKDSHEHHADNEQCDDDGWVPSVLISSPIQAQKNQRSGCQYKYRAEIVNAFNLLAVARGNALLWQKQLNYDNSGARQW